MAGHVDAGQLEVKEAAQAIIEEQGTSQVPDRHRFRTCRCRYAVVLIALIFLPLPVTRKAFPEASIEGIRCLALSLVGVFLAAFVLPISVLIFIFELLPPTGVTASFRVSRTKRSSRI